MNDSTNSAQAIAKILEISNPVVHEVTDQHGIKTSYSSKGLFEVQAAPAPIPSLVSVNTLQGFADLVKAKLEDVNFPEHYLIHVIAYDKVVMVPRVCDEWGRRPGLILATPVECKTFPFGTWLDQEGFVISLASRFAPTEDRTYLLQVASALVSSVSAETIDDGISQQATVRKGIAQKANAVIRPRVALAPFRTFPEIQQPVSEFLFRIRPNEDRAPMLALFEADGGAWKLEAMKTLRKEIEKYDIGVPIIA